MNVFNFIARIGIGFLFEKVVLQPCQYVGLNLNVPF